MTLQQFWDELNQHDWYYMMSDDHSWYTAGMTNINRLAAVAEVNGPEYVAMLAAFTKHHFSGKAWGTAQEPKPERPAR